MCSEMKLLKGTSKRSAKPLCVGSIPTRASNPFKSCVIRASIGHNPHCSAFLGASGSPFSAVNECNPDFATIVPFRHHPFTTLRNRTSGIMLRIACRHATSMDRPGHLAMDVLRMDSVHYDRVGRSCLALDQTQAGQWLADCRRAHRID